MPSDRRTFLRHAAALGLLGPVAAGWGCDRTAGSPDGPGADAPTPDKDVLLRPALVPGPGDAVHITAPAAEPPVAYLSRSDMRVYLDSGYRDWAEHRLAAYVSVTTGLWRIRRPEDDPGVPIIPGDALREFEVVDIGLWDPEMAPTEGDVRLRLGEAVSFRVELACVPLPAEGAWVSGAPLVLARRDGPAGEGGREDFLPVGIASRHDDPGCASEGRSVRLVTWACPPDPQ